jgi:sigma-54 dependent transcriptional regulator, acetoin dehydrogenase operon transcriptional activator AcoR
LAQAQRYAMRRMPLLLQGETGTGKDLLARIIHDAGPTPDAPFIAINCAALPRELVASELFGYAEGAFTGARRSGAKGRFAQAHGGTIFLDEIGDMPLDLQPYLLRALEERTITRLGETTARQIDVRVMAATNRPLAIDVAQGRFRADLFYRLSGASLELPPLRDRLDDLPHLVEHLLRQIVPGDAIPPFVDETVFAKLRTHDWPGNVRELRNMLERMVALSPDGVLDTEFSGLGKSSTPAPRQLRSTERQMILAALAASGGSAKEAARTLGISRATIYRRLSAYRCSGPASDAQSACQ